MKRLGYTRYVAQGGDWGAFVVDQMELASALGVARHPHQHACHRSGRRRRRPPPPVRQQPYSLTAEERRAYEQLVEDLQAIDCARIHGLSGEQDLLRDRGFAQSAWLPGSWTTMMLTVEPPAATVAGGSEPGLERDG